MKISILLPLSNNYPNYEKAIISLINQTYKNIEILICLNGNSQKFNKIIKKKFLNYPYIKFYHLKKNNIVEALNLLIDKSKGSYIARMDADDISHPDRLYKQLEYIKKKKLIFLSTNGEVVDKNFDKLYFHKQNNENKYITNPILHPSIIVRSDILKKFKYRQIPFAEDYELYYRLEQYGIKLNFINENLLFYQLNLKNISNPKRAFYLNLATLSISKSFRENLFINEKFFQLIKYENSFTNLYKNFYFSYILQKSFLKKIIFFLIYLIKKNSIIKKVLFSKLIYFNFKKKKLTLDTKFFLKKSKPLISIIIPTYNSEKTIKKTLNSILNQTYQNFEIIIVDNSDTDETIRLIKKNFNSKKIKIFRIKEKVINGIARNIGVNKSSKKSDLISFCDSDDLWKPDKISNQINFMLNQKSAVCFTNYDFYNPKKNKYIKNYFKIPFTIINFSLLSITNLIGTSSVLINKNLFKAVGGFPESNYFYSFEDYFLWLKIAKKTNFHYLDENLTIYRDDRKNSATKYSRSFLSQRLRLLIFFLFTLDIKYFLKLAVSNLKLIFKTKNKSNNHEYIDLL